MGASVYFVNKTKKEVITYSSSSLNGYVFQRALILIKQLNWSLEDEILSSNHYYEADTAEETRTIRRTYADYMIVADLDKMATQTPVRFGDIFLDDED